MESEMSPSDTIQPDIKVTNWDRNRLDNLLSTHATKWSWKAVEFLVRELLRATIVNDADMPSGVVTMRSRIVFRDDDSPFDRVVTLTYPGEREYFDDALSILTPVGAALIGLSEGQSISYAGPDGRRKQVTVLQVLSQPGSDGRAEITRSPRPS